MTAFINTIIDKASENKQSSVKEIIKELFPTIVWTLGGPQYADGYTKSWLKDMRICHPSNFDKYFQFSIPNGELSNSELQEMLSLTNSYEMFSLFILTLSERGILKNALSQFEAFTDHIPLENGPTFIQTILDIGDQVDHDSFGFTFFSSHTHAFRLIYWFLKRIENIEARGQLLLECFIASKGVSIVHRLLVAEDQQREKDENDYLLTDNDLMLLKAEFVKKLDELSENSSNDLINNTHLHSLLYSWKKWGNETKVSDWLKSQTNSIEGCLTLLQRFVIKSTSQTMGEYNVRVRTYINLNNIEEFIEIAPIQERLELIDESILDPQSKEAFNAFQAALTDRENGKYEDRK